jgi:hypothetical protein
VKTVSSGASRLPVLKLEHGGSAVLHIVRSRTVDVRGEQRTLWECDLALGRGKSEPVAFWPSKGLAAAVSPHVANSPVVRISRASDGGQFAAYTADIAEGPQEQEKLFGEAPKGHKIIRRT